MVSKALKGSVLVSLVVTLMIAGLYAVGLFPTFSTTVFADHVGAHASITITPPAATTNTSREYTLQVGNSTTSGASIDKVTLDIPPAGSGGSTFEVTSSSDVVGGSFGTTTNWTRELALAVNNSVDTIAWSASTTDDAAYGTQTGATTTYAFTATGPSTTQTVTWTVTVRWSNDATHTFTQSMAVESTAPTVTSIKTQDLNKNGQIDAAEVLFSEEIRFASINPADWSIGGVAAVGHAASSTNNQVVTFNLTGATTTALMTTATSTSEITGTAVQDVTYTAGTTGAASTTADIAGNALASIVTATITELDRAAPRTDKSTPTATATSTVTTATPTTVTLAFTEAITNVVLGNFSVGGSTVSGISATSDTVTLTVSAALATDATPLVSYAAGSLTDSSSNSVIGFTVAAADGAKPTPTTTAFAANTTATTTITVVLSETLGGGVVSGDFSVSGTGQTVSSIATTSATVTLTLGTPIATDATPTVTYTAGTLADASGNVAATFSTTTIDSAGPILSSSTWTDVDNSTTLNAGDTILFVFGERIATSTISGTGTSMDTSLAPSAGSYGSGHSLAWNTAETELTVTLAGTPTVVASATVNPANAVTDFFGNADDTIAAPSIVQVTVTVSASPTTVIKNGTVNVTVAISSITDFDAINYTLTYGNVLRFDSVTGGTINGTAIPVMQIATTTTTSLVVQNVTDSPGVTGSGTLATLTFTFTGNSGESSNVTLSAVTISDNVANVISNNTVDTSVAATLVLGDGNGDSSLNALDITAVELIIAGSRTTTPGADANADGVVNALDITKTELIVAAQ